MRIIRDHRPRTLPVLKGGTRPGVAPEDPTACQQDKRFLDLLKSYSLSQEIPKTSGGRPRVIHS